jgi:hypothetical protein
MRSLAGLVLVAVAVGSSEAAVFCAKPSRDGTLNGSVRVREACKRKRGAARTRRRALLLRYADDGHHHQLVSDVHDDHAGRTRLRGFGRRVRGPVREWPGMRRRSRRALRLHGRRAALRRGERGGSMWGDMPYRLHLCALQRGAAERLPGRAPLPLRARAVRPMGRVLQHGPPRLRRGAVLRRLQCCSQSCNTVTLTCD